MGERRAVHFTVTAYGGTDIQDAADDVIRLANFLGVAVHCDFNGVLLMGRPGDDAKMLTAAYYAELRSGNQYPIALGSAEAARG